MGEFLPIIITFYIMPIVFNYIVLTKPYRIKYITPIIILFGRTGFIYIGIIVELIILHYKQNQEEKTNDFLEKNKISRNLIK